MQPISKLDEMSNKILEKSTKLKKQMQNIEKTGNDWTICVL